MRVNCWTLMAICLSVVPDLYAERYVAAQIAGPSGKVYEHCITTDQLSETEARERLRWAVTCGHISQREADNDMLDRRFPTFLNANFENPAGFQAPSLGFDVSFGELGGPVPANNCDIPAGYYANGSCWFEPDSADNCFLNPNDSDCFLL